MQDLKQAAADLLRQHPYVLLLAGFTLTLGYGLVKLAAMVSAMQAV